MCILYLIHSYPLWPHAPVWEAEAEGWDSHRREGGGGSSASWPEDPGQANLWGLSKELQHEQIQSTDHPHGQDKHTSKIHLHSVRVCVDYILCMMFPLWKSKILRKYMWGLKLIYKEWLSIWIAPNSNDCIHWVWIKASAGRFTWICNTSMIVDCSLAPFDCRSLCSIVPGTLHSCLVWSRLGSRSSFILACSHTVHLFSL